MKPTLHHKDFFRHWQQIEPASVDLIFTDPPYGLFGDEKSLTGLTWDVKPDIHKMESIFNTLLKPTGQVVMFVDLNLLLELLSDFTTHFQYRFYFIWVKSGGMPISKQRPINNTEFILVWRKKGSKEKDLTWNPYTLGKNGDPYRKRNYSDEIPTRRKKKSPVSENKDGMRFPKATLYAPSRPNMDKWERDLTNHPCQKPEQLCRKLIKAFTNKGDTVLDPFTGSGSILAASYKSNRNSLGFETAPVYFKQAQRRLDNLTAQGTLF